MVSSNIQKRKKFSIVSEITGMVTSRQMAAPLFNNRMGDPGRRSICQGYCRRDWSWERKWTPWTLPWQLFPLQICMLHAGPQGAYWSLVIPLTLIPQGYKSSLSSHTTRLVTLLLYVPPMPKPLPLPEGKKNLTGGGCNCQRGDAIRLWVEEITDAIKASS